MSVRCIVVNLTLKAKLPINQAYPLELNTIGDHLRKARLDRKLSQNEVSKIIHVTEDTITGWELNRNSPTPKYIKKIIDFLGYSPFNTKTVSLNEQLYYARLTLGLTQEEMAKKIGIDETTVRLIELNLRKMSLKVSKLLHDYLFSISKKQMIKLL